MLENNFLMAFMLLLKEYYLKILACYNQQFGLDDDEGVILNLDFYLNRLFIRLYWFFLNKTYIFTSYFRTKCFSKNIAI